GRTATGSSTPPTPPRRGSDELHPAPRNRADVVERGGAGRGACEGGRVGLHGQQYHRGNHERLPLVPGGPGRLRGGVAGLGRGVASAVRVDRLATRAVLRGWQLVRRVGGG